MILHASSFPPLSPHHAGQLRPRVGCVQGVDELHYLRAARVRRCRRRGWPYHPHGLMAGRLAGGMG